MKAVVVFFYATSSSFVLVLYLTLPVQHDCFRSYFRPSTTFSKTHLQLSQKSQQNDFNVLFKRTFVSTIFSLPLLFFNCESSDRAIIGDSRAIASVYGSSIEMKHPSQSFPIETKFVSDSGSNSMFTQLPLQYEPSSLLLPQLSFPVFPLSLSSNQQKSNEVNSPIMISSAEKATRIMENTLLNTIQEGDVVKEEGESDEESSSSSNSVGAISKVVDQATHKINEQKQILINMFNALKDAYLVDNFDTFIAVSIAEAVSGIVAGFSSRKFADFLKDKKKDSVFTKLSSTGVFFGSRSFFRTISTLIGIPRPIALIIGSLSGSLLSELTKYIGRIFASEIEKDRDIMSYELNRQSSDNGGINSFKFIQPPVNIPKSINPNKQFFFNIFSGKSNNNNNNNNSNIKSPTTAKFISKPVNIPKSLYPKKQPFIGLFIAPIRNLLINITRDAENKKYQQQQQQPLEFLEVLEVIVVKEKNLNELLVNKDKQEVISKKEIAADLVKWLTFDALEEIVTIPENPYFLKICTYFGLGSVSASAGYLLKRILNKKLLNENETLWKDILEGGVLFATYSLLQNYLMSMAPPELSQELPFYKVLESFESAVEEKL